MDERRKAKADEQKYRELEKQVKRDAMKQKNNEWKHSVRK